ncbi:histidine kinase [Candidatus Pelagadaptatus aseana]|uniref:histidine kinase n=1 Tax=Candidatus Pelagadaptatus aseana TaxID=3120508 RepID=UPI003C6FF873
MSFLVIVAVFAIVQFWGPVTSLHRDQWWQRWAGQVNGWKLSAEISLLLQVLVPVLLVWWLLALVESWSSWLLLLISIPMLLYCLGRGDFTPWVKGYLEASRRQDNEVAAEYAQRLGVDTDPLNGWADLHRAVLRRIAYGALERMFVAIFWFFLLGIAGALLYRLAVFARDEPDNSEAVRLLAARLCWLMEWPVIRVLGLSLALTGNYMGGYYALSNRCFSFDCASEDALESMVHGALNVNSSELTQEGITEQEVEVVQPLLSRTLILWLCVLGLISVF